MLHPEHIQYITINTYFHTRSSTTWSTLLAFESSANKDSEIQIDSLPDNFYAHQDGFYKLLPLEDVLKHDAFPDYGLDINIQIC